MERAYKWVRLISAVLTVIVTAAFVYEAADIYFTGVSPDNFSAPGVAVEQMYRRADIAERLSRLLPLIIVYVLAVIAGAVLRILAGGRERPRAIKPSGDATPAKARRVARIAVFAVAALFIGLGILNGGLWDVLVKAVNICTECIGLG